MMKDDFHLKGFGSGKEMHQVVWYSPRRQKWLDIYEKGEK